MIHFTVLGEPKALKRHRMGKGYSFDPSKGDKQDFLWMAKENAPSTPLDQPLKVTLYFDFQRPKSHFGTGKNKDILKENSPNNHTSRPDIDNLVKFVLDALNTIYWRDDSVICELHVFKFYSTKPRTTIHIELIEP